MTNYLQVFKTTFLGSVDWIWKSICFEVPWHENYFWGLIVISLIVWGLEMLFPWRKEQSVFRKDFWLDSFYMFFNFFVFTIMISGVYSILETLFFNLGIRIQSIAFVNLANLPIWSQLIIFFLVQDFVQWFTHVLLHRFEFFWRFHKVHHSVKEMGFAAHLRYHWMETIVYRTIEYIPLGLIGFSVEDFFVIHMIAVIIGHLNHSNLNMNYGPFQYIFNKN